MSLSTCVSYTVGLSVSTSYKAWYQILIYSAIRVSPWLSVVTGCGSGAAAEHRKTTRPRELQLLQRTEFIRAALQVCLLYSLCTFSAALLKLVFTVIFSFGKQYPSSYLLFTKSSVTSLLYDNKTKPDTINASIYAIKKGTNIHIYLWANTRGKLTPGQFLLKINWL